MDAFKRKLSDALEKRMGSKYTLDYTFINKNNGVEKNSLIIFKDGSKCASSIYIDELIQAYEQKKISIDEIADRIFHAYVNNNSVKDDMVQQVFEKLKCYETCKDDLYIKLINREKNRAFLQGKVYQPFHDLALALYYRVNFKDQVVRSIAISEDMYKKWNLGLPKEKVIRDALDNGERKNPVKVQRIIDIMMENFGISECIPELTSVPDTADDMLLITNDIGVNGAVSIMYGGVLKEVSEKHNNLDLIIIPSSIHEVVVLLNYPDKAYDRDELQEIVCDVNHKHVLPEEVLSDNVYLYKHDTDELVIWKE